MMRQAKSLARLALPLWLVGLAPVMVLASVPTSNAAQAMLGVTAVALVGLLKPFAC